MIFCGVPEFCRKLLSAQYDTVDLKRIDEGYEANRLVSLRINTLKTTVEQAKTELIAAGIELESVDWYKDAFLVNTDEARLRTLGLYERGEIYLQSLSSMLPPLYLGAQAGENVLDMTAAPGGKTTQISALTGGKALVTACERDRVRFERLSYNVAKQGAPRVTLMNCDAAKLDEFFRFDKILLDAPCSGSGTLSVHERISISEKMLNYCQKAQAALLDKAISIVKRGGEIVYSTCSLFASENEEIVETALSRGKVELVKLQPISERIPTLPCKDGMVTVCPSERYEGFFVAKLRKL